MLSGCSLHYYNIIATAWCIWQRAKSSSGGFVSLISKHSICLSNICFSLTAWSWKTLQMTVPKQSIFHWRNLISDPSETWCDIVLLTVMSTCLKTSQESTVVQVLSCTYQIFVFWNTKQQDKRSLISCMVTLSERWSYHIWPLRSFGSEESAAWKVQSASHCGSRWDKSHPIPSPETCTF